MFNLPVQVAPGFPLRVRGAADASGGWTMATFDSLEDVKYFMAQNPSAVTPCWKRLVPAFVGIE
jgi:hypothetical protein